MKGIISQLNKTFESRIKLGIMSVLMVNDWVDFNTLKQLLEITDGNLASHLKVLEEKELITMKKQFIGRKPKTSYEVSETGRALFAKHVEALEKLIKSS